MLLNESLTISACSTIKHRKRVDADRGEIDMISGYVQSHPSGAIATGPDPR